jgi:hypothetical protein
MLENLQRFYKQGALNKRDRCHILQRAFSMVASHRESAVGAGNVLSQALVAASTSFS